MTKRPQNQSKTTNIYWILVCATLLVFFYRVHPMILFDTDDWLYCYAARDMLPQVGLWNPARVLPEVLMPLVSYISAYLFYPVSGDYIMSLALGYAIALTVFIMAYFYLAYRLLRQRLAISQTHALAATTIFIVLHFLVYRTADANNAYTFYSSNVTCVFYYIIPTLLNIILILYCELQGGEVFIKGRYLQNGGVLLGIYLAIFSNLFNSCLLPIWCGVRLLERLAHEKRVSIQFFKDSASHLLIIAMWLVCMAYELTGGRADGLNDQFSLSYLWECMRTFLQQYRNLNHMTELVILACVALQIFCLIRGRREYLGIVLRMAAIFTITGLYLCLLCAKVGKWYLGSTTYINATIVLLLFVYYSLGICVKEYPQVCMLAPLAAGILFFNINRNGGAGVFKESNLADDSANAYRCSTYLVETIQRASDEGVAAVEIHIPQFDSGDN